MADKKKMSVAEILAAARGEGKAAGKEAAMPADQPAAAQAETPQSSADSPAATPAAPKPGSAGRPSVKDILAMARSKGAAASPVDAAPAKPKPAPKTAAGKPAPAKKPNAPVAGPKKNVQRDTASILAAARSGAKPGPVGKAEAPVVAKPQARSAAKPPPRPVPPRPARPAAKKPAKNAATDERRGFLGYAVGSFMAVGFTALSMTGGLFGLGLARFFFPNVLAEPPSRFKVGSKEGFPVGKVETKYVAQYGVWVVNSEFEGVQQIYALKTVCTHLGCTPNWLEAEQKFKCPCHGSGFYKDGINFEGPAPRPLERYAIRIADDGQLEVDKSKSFQEELGQWNDPESFVTA
ncbi:MAG: ubiquinol-cytochrome c reductase iron-sulfur subunit [Pirellulales bacterium]|jgi:cytochrome b6-f complex iron-sulfur subunit